MKKIIISILIFLIIIAGIFAFYLNKVLNPKEVLSSNINEEEILKGKILSNSSWIYLEKEDFIGYLNGTYTENVQKIITSLEEAIPVIFQTTNTKLSNIENGIFIIASAFDASGNVYTYYYNPEKNKYEKTSVSLEYLLEDTNAVYIYNETEGL